MGSRLKLCLFGLALFCMCVFARLRFDFPMMVCEMVRGGLDLLRIAEWRFADSLHALKDAKLADNCAKLQCLTRACGAHALAAHRALDDVRVLLEVCAHAAAKQGVSVAELLRPCVRSIDTQRTLQHVALAS